MKLFSLSVPLPWCFGPQSMKFQLGNSLCCSPLCNSYSAIQLTKVSFSSRNFFWNYRTVLQIKMEYPEIPSQKQILVNWLVTDGYLQFWNFEIWRVLEKIRILEVSPFLKTSSTLPFSTVINSVFPAFCLCSFFFFLMWMYSGIKCQCDL